MVGIVATCGSCGFENPRSWVSCARCHHLLGPNRGRAGYAAVDTDQVTLAGLRPPDTPDEAKTMLFRGLEDTIEPAQPLLGQERALGLLRRLLKESFSLGEARLVSLHGERGMGKTRLLVAASEIAAKSWIDIRVLHAACRPADDGPHAPFSRLLLERFGITPASSPSQVRDQMLQAVRDALPSATERRGQEVAQLLGHVAGVPFPDGDILHRLRSAPQSLQFRIKRAVTDFLRGDARRRPLLLLLDDMGLAERDAWDVIDGVLGADAPIAIVAVGSDNCAERVAALRHRGRADVGTIQPLDGAATEQLTRLLVPGLREVPPPLRDALQHRSQGNPSSLHELIAAVRDRGLFQADGDHLEVDLGRFEQGDFPLSMHDAIRARLSLLSRAEHALLVHASVLGERFWDGALLALARAERTPPTPENALSVWRENSDELALADTLEHLRQKHFVVPITSGARPGLAEYTFNYAGTRALLYADLDEADRKRMHGVVARWMSATTGLEGVAHLIAPHLAKAGQHGRAGRAYLRAAVEERKRMRTTMALRLIEKALPLIEAEDIGKRLDALHEHGTLLMTLGKYDRAQLSFDEMLALAWSLGARGRAGAALNRLARLHRQRGEIQTALEHCKAALSLFRTASDERGVAGAYDDLAQLHRFRGNLDSALAAAKEALELRNRLRDPRGQAVSLNTIGYVELDRGNFDVAESHFERALGLREQARDYEGMVQTRIALGRLASQRGEATQALSIFEQALATAREMDHRRFQSYLLSSLAEVYLGLERYDDARASLAEAHGLAEEMRDQRALVEIQRNLGMVALASGESRAPELLSGALDLAQRYGAAEAIAKAHRALGRMHARTLFDASGDAPGRARASYDECIRMFSDSGAIHEVARSRAEFGLYLSEQGQVGDAREELEKAAAVLERLALPEADQVRRTLARI